MKKLIVALILIAVISQFYYVYGTTEEKVITVKSLDHKINQSGSGEDMSIEDIYLVFTENDGVFKNTDAFLWWKFNSSDIQNQLTPGKHYLITYYGWRIPFLSKYPNIVKVKEI